MCFALGLAADHQQKQRKNLTWVTDWAAVLPVINAVYLQEYPEFAKLYPTGLPNANKLRTGFSDRYRQRKSTKWRTRVEQCTPEEIRKMHAIAQVVIDIETSLGNQNTNPVRVPAPDASRWVQYQIRYSDDTNTNTTAAGVKRKRPQKEESEDEEEWQQSDHSEDVEDDAPTGSSSVSHEVASMEQSIPYEKEFQGGPTANGEDSENITVSRRGYNNGFQHQNPFSDNFQALPAPTTSRHTRVTPPVESREKAPRELRPQERFALPKTWDGYENGDLRFPDPFSPDVGFDSGDALVDTRPEVPGGRKYGDGAFYLEPNDIDLPVDYHLHLRDVNPVAFPMDGSSRKGDRKSGYLHQTDDDDDGIMFSQNVNMDPEDNDDHLQDLPEQPMNEHFGMQMGEQIGQQANDEEYQAPLSHGQQILRRKEIRIEAEAWAKRIQYNRPGDHRPELFPKHLLLPNPFRSYVGDGDTEAEYTWAACKETLIKGVQHQRWNILWDALEYVPGINLNTWDLVKDLIDPLAESTGVSRQSIALAVEQAMAQTPLSSLPLQRLLAAPARSGELHNGLEMTVEQINSQPRLAMIHTSDVDFSTDQPTYIARKAPSGAAAPDNHIRFQPKQFISHHDALYKQTGEVRRVLLRDEVTGQAQEVDVMLCDDRICGECKPNGPRNYDYAYQRHELPLVHHKDVMMLEDKGLVFAPKKQTAVAMGAGIVQQDIHQVLFSGGKLSKVIFCDKESCVACLGAICPKSLTELE